MEYVNAVHVNIWMDVDVDLDLDMPATVTMCDVSHLMPFLQWPFSNSVHPLDLSIMIIIT